MKIIKRVPGVGYLDNWLWIPKTHAHPDHIASTFTYVGKNNEAIEAWREELHHFRVPRNYLSQATLPQLGFRVYDARVTQFQRIDIKSRVVLDAREPSKDYQRRGSEALLATTDGILCLRCGAGKTPTALHSAAQLHVPMLILVSDDSLAEQWYEEIMEFLEVDDSDVGFIGGSRGKGKLNWENPITIAHVQTIARRAHDGELPQEFCLWPGVVIPDEAHIMGAPYFNAALPPFHGRRWALTATPTREDQFDSLLKYTVGDVVYSYLIPDIMPEVYFVRLPTVIDFGRKVVHEATHDSNKKFHFGMTFGYMATELNDRTEAVVKSVNEALAVGRQALVLCHSKAMTEILGKRFPNAGVVNGDVAGQERRRRIRECNPVISIMTLGKQALNKPSLNTLFVVEPFSKAGILQQTMGRVLRKFSGTERRLIVFFEDVNVKPLARLCGKIRLLLNRWPREKGGRIPYKIVGYKRRK